MNKKKLTITIELTRDSVCVGDDIDAPHEKNMSLNSIMETKKLVARISQNYLPKIGGKNHKWECLMNDRIIAVIEKDKIIPVISSITYLRDNKIHFKYYSAMD